jgi:hypothetical protein
MKWLVTLALLAGCGSDTSYLDSDQGPCTGLDESTCLGDDRCQQSYVEAGLQPGPLPLRCLQLEHAVTSVTPCAGLGQGDCRDRADCSPVYVQQLGPADGPVGDPEYDRCADPSTLQADE